jgi:hypothetical protein
VKTGCRGYADCCIGELARRSPRPTSCPLLGTEKVVTWRP